MQDVHAYNTRFSCADNIFAQKSRLIRNLKSFPAFGTRLWNCLYPDWRKLTKRAFKGKIHKLLLTVLRIEDYYVDAHPLTLNLNISDYYITWYQRFFSLVGGDKIERRSREDESRSGEQKKPLVPTDNNLTSMPTPISFD